MIPREADFTATKHESSPTNAKLLSNASSSSTTSWSRLKDPRIVRVSRALGGKDRHSKVCTVKGLRDRRVRLSVPTAIQLYDLQERLGLNQPSKVVDWLLNAAKHEIDELPPLQIPTFMQDLTSMNSHDQFVASQLASSDKHGLKISSGFNWNDPTKDVSGETSDDRNEIMMNNWAARNEDHQERSRQLFNRGEYTNNLVSSRQNPSSQLMSNNNTSVPFSSSSFLRWDPSNLTLSHPPVSGLGSTHDHQDLQNLNLAQFPSSRSHHHQVLVYQPAGMATQAYFPASQIANVEFDQKQSDFWSSEFSNSSFSTSQSVHDDQSTTQPHVMRPFYLSMTANLLPSQANINAGTEQNERNELHSP